MNARDGRHDFDFLFGRWHVRNRRLREPLAHSDDWYEFDATSTEEPLLGGLANLERYDAPLAPQRPIHAIAVRLYDEASALWNIFWSRAGSGRFEIPTVGRFENEIGTFYAREEYAGRPIEVRFLWTHDGPSSCRWEQAFSADGGEAWEINWIMEFRRASE